MSESNGNASEREFTLYIRRCHICDSMVENVCEAKEYGPGGSDPAVKCQSCGKYLAPFVFCYPALKVGDQAATQLDQNRADQQRKKPIYPPLIGLAIYW